MYKSTKIENKLIDKINEILNDFKDFEQPFTNNSGDIIIRKKSLTLSHTKRNIAALKKPPRGPSAETAF